MCRLDSRGKSTPLQRLRSLEGRGVEERECSTSQYIYVVIHLLRKRIADRFKELAQFEFPSVREEFVIFDSDRAELAGVHQVPAAQ